MLAALALQALAPTLVFKDVSVVDVQTGRILRNQDVTITGNQISSVQPVGHHHSKSAHTVNAKGKYLIPGLWDCHMHNDSVANTRDFFLPLYIANGVTGVRDMCGDVYPANDLKDGVPIEALRQLQSDIKNQKAIGPRMVIGSVIVDGPSPYGGIMHVKNADEGRKAVEYVRHRGADFIKVYSGLPKDAYYAIVDQCKKDHYVFAGHTPESVTAAEASDAGQRSIEHLTRVVEGCCTPRSKPEKNSQQLYMKPAEEKLRLANSYDPKLAQKLFAKFKADHTWQCPTTTVLRSSAYRNQPWFVNDPRVKYMPKDIAADWDPKREPMNQYYKPKDWHAARALYKLELRIIGDMGKAGVPMLAGTDEPIAFCFPGFGIHDELELFQKCGLTPLQALQTATINPAQYFQTTSTLGTVHKGKLADLVLLDANPLKDIRNTNKIAGVVANGRYFSRADIRRLLNKIKARAKK